MIFYKCYYLWENNCNGACQGASNCIIAERFREEFFYKEKKPKVTRIEMLKYIFLDYIIREIKWKFGYWGLKKDLEKIAKEICDKIQEENDERE